MIGDEFWIPPFSWNGGGMTIRAFTVADAKHLQQAAVESYEHLKPWLPWANPTQSLEQSEEIICRLSGLFYANSEFTVSVWDGDELIGGSGFHLRGRSVTSKSGEIGMWIRSSRANQGWGTRLLEQMLEWGFTEWGWERLFWQCDTRNIASARVAEKCGLVREGTFRSDAIDSTGKRRDTHQYAILKSEWPKR